MEVKLSDQSDAQRIADRLKSSTSADAVSSQTTYGTGPTRTITTVYHSGLNTNTAKPIPVRPTSGRKRDHV